MDDPGQCVAGRYVVEKRLGAGRGGRVFAAQDTRTGARVALKLRDAAAATGLDVERLALRAVEHPHLVRIFDAGTDAGRTFVVTELVPGGSLADLPRPFAAEMLHLLADQMLDALAFLHAQGILHGDVKTENMLVAALAPPHFKLADFGLAQRSVDAAAGTTRGSPAFMAPEIVRGELPDERSDLYALGVTLYECAFGELPFDEADVRALLLRHLTETPRRLQDPGAVEPRLVALLRRLLAKEPAERPVDARAALAVWRGEAAAAPRWVPPRLGILVGREAELAALERTLAGDTAVASVDGAPGLGKTRLLLELALRAGLQGVRALWWTPAGLQGREAGDGGSLAAPVADSTSRVAASDAEATADAVPIPHETLLASEPRALAAARASEVHIRLGTAPWVLLVDDIDDAPAWFVDALAFLLREVAGQPSHSCLVCVAGRERAAALAREALEAGGYDVPPPITLQPWDRQVLETAASALLGARRLHPDLVQLLEAATGGVPAEVEAACQQLAEKGLLRLDTRGALTIAAETTPESILQPRSARAAAALARCTPTQGTLMRLLAALRWPASLPLLRALDSTFPGAVSTLQRSGLVTAVRTGSTLKYAPAHAGIRQATLAALSVPERRDLHDRIAAVLEHAPGLAPEEEAVLHRAHGSDLAAARAAVAQLEQHPIAETRPEVLQEAYESLLQLWPPDLDAAARVDVELSLCDTLLRLGAYDDVLRLATDVAHDTAATTMRERFRNRAAEALVARGEAEKALLLLSDPGSDLPETRFLRARVLQQMARNDEALNVCENLLSILPAQDPLVDRVGDLCNLTLRELGKFDIARPKLKSLIESHAARNAIPALAADWTSLGLVDFGQGHISEAKQCFGIAHDLYVRLGDRFGTARTLNCLGAAYGEEGNYSEAHEAFRQGLDLSRRLGETESASYLLANLGHLSFLQGRYREALAQTSLGADIARRRSMRTSHNSIRVVRAGILATLGLEEECLSETRRLLVDTDVDLYRGQVYLIRGDLAVRRGDVEEARRCIELAGEALARRSMEDEHVLLQLLSARLAHLEGRSLEALSAARIALARAEPLSLPAVIADARALTAELMIDSSPMEAIEIALQGLDSARMASLPEAIWRFERVLGRSAFLKGQVGVALLHYEACIEVLQALSVELPPEASDAYFSHPDRARVFNEVQAMRRDMERPNSSE